MIPGRQQVWDVSFDSYTIYCIAQQPYTPLATAVFERLQMMIIAAQ